MLCLSPYQRVFYALASWCPSRRTRDFSKRRGLIACVQTTTPTAELLGPNHLRSLPAAPHSDLSARQYKGVIPGYDVRPSASQHVIRGYLRSSSATALLRHFGGKIHNFVSRVSMISEANTSINDINHSDLTINKRNGWLLKTFKIKPIKDDNNFLSCFSLEHIINR